MAIKLALDLIVVVLLSGLFGPPALAAPPDLPSETQPSPSSNGPSAFEPAGSIEALSSAPLTNQTDPPAESPILASDISLIDFVQFVAPSWLKRYGSVWGAALVVGLLLMLIFVRRRQTVKKRPAAVSGSAPAGFPSPLDTSAIDPPRDIFPSRWLADSNREVLSGWIKEAAQKAAAAFWAALPVDHQKIPPASELKTANNRLLVSLKNSLSEPELSEALTGAPTQEAAFLAAHLGTLLPPLKLPVLEPDAAAPRACALALLAALGAAAGLIIGNWAFSFLGQVGLSGFFLGAGLGAAGFTFIASYLASNNRLRRILIVFTGGLAAFDAAATIAKSAALPSFFGTSGSFFKRLGLYMVIGLALLVIKPQKTYDRSKWQKILQAAVEAYLELAAAAAAVIMFRLQNRSGPVSPPPEIRLAGEIIGPVRRLMSEPAFSESLPLAELVQKLTNFGFELTPEAGTKVPSVLIWQETMSESYDTFGLVKAGQSVTVEEEPIIKDGRVFKKGLVAP
ncbi:MAG: hypothetical protein LBT47_02040 [Deltaproteobacteria bacterium]|jgi:hypothetical protein|nr:hypothetical protein [Deltaproteobacteria bacterium]